MSDTPRFEQDMFLRRLWTKPPQGLVSPQFLQKPIPPTEEEFLRRWAFFPLPTGRAFARRLNG